MHLGTTDARKQICLLNTLVEKFIKYIFDQLHVYSCRPVSTLFGHPSAMLEHSNIPWSLGIKIFLRRQPDRVLIVYFSSMNNSVLEETHHFLVWKSARHINGVASLHSGSKTLLRSVDLKNIHFVSTASRSICILQHTLNVFHGPKWWWVYDNLFKYTSRIQLKLKMDELVVLTNGHVDDICHVHVGGDNLGGAHDKLHNFRQALQENTTQYGIRHNRLNRPFH